MCLRHTFKGGCMKKMLIYSIVLGMMYGTSRPLSDTNQVTKLLYHSMVVDKKIQTIPSLAFGIVSINFSDNAQFEHITYAENGKKKREDFFFPYTKFTDATKRLLSAFNHQHHQYYKMHASSAQQNGKDGVLIQITYDP